MVGQMSSKRRRYFVVRGCCMSGVLWFRRQANSRASGAVKDSRGREHHPTLDSQNLLAFILAHDLPAKSLFERVHPERSDVRRSTIPSAKIKIADPSFLKGEEVVPMPKAVGAIDRVPLGDVGAGAVSGDDDQLLDPPGRDVRQI